MEKDPIKKTHITNEVYKKMKNNFISGEWSCGEKIPSEKKLCKKYDVSRNTIRNVIQKFKTMGILITQQGSGTFVNDSFDSIFINSFIPEISLNNEELKNINEFRNKIEKECHKLAAERGDDKDFKKINKCLVTMENSTNDYKKFTVADYQFHLQIAKASQNKIFYRAILKLSDVLYNFLEVMNKNGDLEHSVKQHRKIFDVIKNRDDEIIEKVSKSQNQNRTKELLNFLDDKN